MRALDKILPAEPPKCVASTHTHVPSARRARLVETRSPWDQHTLATRCPSQSKSPSSVPLSKSSSSISFAPSIRPILDSPLEDSVSLLGLRRQAAQSNWSAGDESDLLSLVCRRSRAS